MAKPHEESFCLGCGWTGDRAPAGCPACGAQELAAVRGGALVAFPAGTVPCGKCGSTEHPLVFRATSRVASFVWLIRERRLSGYWCEGCARKHVAASLAYTGLAGWWGFLGAFFWTPRATYFNWRAVWAPPRRPLAWGAEPVAELATLLTDARMERDDVWSGFDSRP